MNNRTLILITLSVVIINLIIGHFFAPIGMMMTPIVLIIITIFIVFNSKKLSPISISSLIISLTIIHDIGIKLYAGGTHDTEGLGWMHLMLLLGLIPSYLLMIIGIIRKKESTWFRKVIAIVIFPLIVTIYLHFFNDLGL